MSRTSPEKLEKGLYHVGADGEPVQLLDGSYTVDEEGEVGPTVNWQSAMERIPWERVDQVLQGWGKRGSFERIVNLVGMYLLVGAILGIAALLALRGIIEGQALVGFLGAALGYLLARGKTGLLGQG